MSQKAHSGNARWLGVPEEPSGSRRCCLNQFPRQNQEGTALPTVTRVLLARSPSTQGEASELELLLPGEEPAAAQGYPL